MASWQSATDRDTFTFTVPADVPVAPGARARANFWFQPTRDDGNGSSYAVGTIYVVDPRRHQRRATWSILRRDRLRHGDDVDLPPGNLSFPGCS